MPQSAVSSVRIDKWLWAVRLFKTRTQASDACRLGRVKIGRQEVKPSREVRIGETITVEQEWVTRCVKVLALLEKRVGAKWVPEFAEDLTDPAEMAQARQARQQAALSPPVAPQFRPSGKTRQLIRDLYSPDE